MSDILPEDLDPAIIARDALQLPTPYAAPEAPLEIALAEVFASALGVSPIGIDDHFSDLGGDSFMALQMMLVLEARHGLKVEPGILAQHETPRALARYLDRQGQPLSGA